MPRWLAALSFALWLVLAPSASAAPRCDPAIEAWVARCAATSARRLELMTCHGGVLVVRDPSARLDVELRARSERSFRAVAGLGLSPVGQFADWSRESPERRAALDALVACAERDGALPLERTPSGAAPSSLRPLRPPWLLLAALTAFAFARRLHPSRELLGGLALGLLAGLARAAALGGSFFHQNGQGPGWIAYALRHDAGLAAYGPGFPELFGAAARLFGGDAERGVWLVQSLLAAAVPPCAWWLARRLGAGPWLGAALGLTCALDPLLGRLAGTESYFATGLSLGMLATAACASAAPRLSTRGFWLPVLASGLLAAQALRVHPSLWPATLLAPLPLLLGPGSLRRRSKLFGVGLGLFLLLAALFAGPAVAEVLRGPLGQKWLPGARPRWELLGQNPLAYLLAAAVALGALMRSWRGAAVALAGAGVLATARLTDLLSDPNPALSAAHQRLFLPAALVVVATAGARLARGRDGAVAAGLVAVSLLTLPTRLPLTRLPTDALEAAFVRELRGTLPTGARVAYLERAGTQLALLPLYAGERAPLGDGDAGFDLGTLPPPAYYYRSSLCETASGAPVCAALERSAPLEPVAERTLPALPSMRWNAYASSEVRVGLFRVKR